MNSASIINIENDLNAIISYCKKEICKCKDNKHQERKMIYILYIVIAYEFKNYIGL